VIFNDYISRLKLQTIIPWWPWPWGKTNKERS